MKRLISAALGLLCTVGVFAFTTDTIKVASKYLPDTMKVTVVVPDLAEDQQRFPVVYMLNGYGGDYRDWTRHRSDYGEMADKYKMILVMPSGMNSWYWDSPTDPKVKMETFFTQTLIPYIDTHLPTVKAREGRAITGLSMGGHGALWLATRHPDLFVSAGSMSGGVNILPFVGRWSMDKILGPYEQNKERWESHTVARMVPQMKDAGLNLIIDCGNEDFFADVNNALHHDLLAAGVPHDYTSRPGNHSWNYWNNSILYHLMFFNEAFNRTLNRAQ